MNLKKETPQSLRVADIGHGTSYAVFLQNTPILWDAVPRVGTLGWYALPRWGKLSDGYSMRQSEESLRTKRAPSAREGVHRTVFSRSMV